MIDFLASLPARLVAALSTVWTIAQDINTAIGTAVAPYVPALLVMAGMLVAGLVTAVVVASALGFAPAPVARVLTVARGTGARVRSWVMADHNEGIVVGFIGLLTVVGAAAFLFAFFPPVI